MPAQDLAGDGLNRYGIRQRAQSIVQLDEHILPSLAVPTFRLARPLLCRVAYGEKDQVKLVEPTAVQQHHAATEAWERVFDLVVVETPAARENILKQPSQLRDVPLAIAQLVNETSFRLLRISAEELVEGLICRVNLEVAVENQQRFTHAVDQFLGEFYSALEFTTKPLTLGVIGYRKQDAVFFIRPADALGVEPHDAPADLLEVMFDPVILDRAVLLNNLLKQPAQLRNVPLPVAKLINAPADCLLARHLKLI